MIVFIVKKGIIARNHLWQERNDIIFQVKFDIPQLNRLRVEPGKSPIGVINENFCSNSRKIVVRPAGRSINHKFLLYDPAIEIEVRQSLLDKTEYVAITQSIDFAKIGISDNFCNGRHIGPELVKLTGQKTVSAKRKVIRSLYIRQEKRFDE